MASEISPISSRKRVPRSASSKRPLRCCSAPVKAPRSCPKSSLSMILAESSAQWSFTKRSSFRGRELMDGLRDQLLPRSGLAVDEHGRPRRRDLDDLVLEVLHHPRVAGEMGDAGLWSSRFARSYARLTSC